jgi:hypothetical protein
MAEMQFVAATNSYRAPTIRKTSSLTQVFIVLDSYAHYCRIIGGDKSSGRATKTSSPSSRGASPIDTFNVTRNNLLCLVEAAMENPRTIDNAFICGGQRGSTTLQSDFHG